MLTSPKLLLTCPKIDNTPKNDAYKPQNDAYMPEIVDNMPKNDAYIHQNYLKVRQQHSSHFLVVVAVTCLWSSQVRRSQQIPST